MKLLFPCDYNNIRNVDFAFLEEYNAAKLVGFKTMLFDFDKFAESGELKVSEDVFDEPILYRGWMLSKSEYMKLYNRFERKLITNPVIYSYTHLYSLNSRIHETFDENNIPYVKHFSMFEKVENNIDVVCNNFEMCYPKIFKSDRTSFFIIKDGVKSEKGTKYFMLEPGEDFREKIVGFIEARGKLFNGYITFKEAINLKKTKDDKTYEIRAFVWNNKLLTIACNSNHDFVIDYMATKLITDIIEKLKLIHFYTIDIMLLENGNWCVNELGDGQVSGLGSNQNVLEFYNKLKLSI